MAKIYFVALLGVIGVLWLVHAKWFRPLNDLFDACWVGDARQGGPWPEWLQRLRGNNYWVSPDKKHRRYCLITSWALTHVLLYALIGFLYPALFWPTLMVGVGYEVMEWITLDCHDVLDIMWNSLGFLLGAALRGVLSR